MAIGFHEILLREELEFEISKPRVVDLQEQPFVADDEAHAVSVVVASSGVRLAQDSNRLVSSPVSRQAPAPGRCEDHAKKI